MLKFGRWTAILSLACAAPLCGAAIAHADDAKPAQPKAKKVCRSTIVTGSRMATSTCHTAEEWEAIDEANAQAAQKLTGYVMHQGSINTGSTTAPANPTLGH